MSFPNSLTLLVLGHHDEPRFRRAVHSAIVSVEAALSADMGDVHVNVMPVIDRTGRGLETHSGYRVDGGTTARGRSEALKLWARFASDTDYVYQLDGDDVLYPHSARQILRDIRASAADLIGYYGFDVPARKTGGMWGKPAVPGWPEGPGVEEGWDRDPYVTGWMPRVWSVRGVALGLWDEDMKAYGDAIVCYRALAAHLAGRMRCVISTAGDVLAVDQGVPGSTQKSANMKLWSDVVKERREAIVARERSNWGQLPILHTRLDSTIDGRREVWQRYTEQFLGKP